MLFMNGKLYPFGTNWNIVPITQTKTTGYWQDEIGTQIPINQEVPTGMYRVRTRADNNVFDEVIFKADASGNITGYNPKIYQTGSNGGGFFGSSPLGNFLNDMVDLAPLAAALIAPQYLPLVAGAKTAIQGGDIGDILKSAGTSYALGQLGQQAGVFGDQAAAATQYGTGLNSAQTAMLAAQEAGLGTVADVAGNVIGQVGTSVVSPIITGRDTNPLDVLLSSGVSAATPFVTNQIEGFSKLPVSAQNSINTIVASELLDKDPTNALIAEALKAGKTAYSDFKQDSSPTITTPSGVQLAAADTDTASDASAPYTVSVGGSPIYEGTKGAENVSAPFGYRLMTLAEGDQRPVGSYYDATQNAWFVPTNEVQKLQEQLTSGAQDTLSGGSLGSESDLPPVTGEQTTNEIPAGEIDSLAPIGSGNVTSGGGGAIDVTGTGGVGVADVAGTGTGGVGVADVTGTGTGGVGVADVTGTGTGGVGVADVTGTGISTGGGSLGSESDMPPSNGGSLGDESDMPPSNGGSLGDESDMPAPPGTTTPGTGTGTGTTPGTGTGTIPRVTIPGTTTPGSTTQNATGAFATTPSAPIENLTYKNAYTDFTPLNPLLFSLAGLGPVTGSSGQQNPLDRSATDKDVAFGTSLDNEPQEQSNAPMEWFSKGGLAGQHPMGEPQYYSEGALTSLQIKGDGDGTSDDIPAMVAKDEYVLPADIVSSLGNGSSDAGASVLDMFVRQIRSHKHSNDPGELPPDSVGPLEYLSAAISKGQKHGRNI